MAETVNVSSSPGANYTWTSGKFAWSSATAGKNWSTAYPAVYALSVATDLSFAELVQKLGIKRSSESLTFSEKPSRAVALNKFETLNFVETYYAIHLLIDKTAEQVHMRFGLRHRPDSGLTPDFEVNGNSYQVVAEQLFIYRELRNNRGWSDRQSFMTGYRWAEKRLIDPLPLYVYTLSTRFTAPEAAGHVWNGNFLTGFNVPFADSPFDECFVTVNLHPTLGGCLVEGVDTSDVEQTDYQSSAQVREMQFPDLRVTPPAVVRAGDPAVFTVHMLDGIGDVSTRDAEVFLESVNGYLPISRRQTQGGTTTATVLTTGLTAGDTVRLKAGFKFYPGCADAQVTLS